MPPRVTGTVGRQKPPAPRVPFDMKTQTGIDLFSLAGSSVTAQLAVRRSDGRRFKRYQDRTARGYRWGAWELTEELPVYTPNGHDPVLYDVTGSGWVLCERDAAVRLPDVDAAAPRLSGWVGVAFMRSVGCDGTVEVRVRPNDLRGVEVRAGVDVNGWTTVRVVGPVAARHLPRLDAVGREALRQVLADLGPAACEWLAGAREAALAAGPEWAPPPDHLPCSLADYSLWRVVA